MYVENFGRSNFKCKKLRFHLVYVIDLQSSPSSSSYLSLLCDYQSSYYNYTPNFIIYSHHTIKELLDNLLFHFQSFLVRKFDCIFFPLYVSITVRLRELS